MSHLVRTRQEIDELKADWRGDPSWDIENTAGFEAHREELRAYRLSAEDAYEQQKKADFRAYLQKVGCTDNPALGRELKELRDTMACMVEQLAARGAL